MDGEEFLALVPGGKEIGGQAVPHGLEMDGVVALQDLVHLGPDEVGVEPEHVVGHFEHLPKIQRLGRVLSYHNQRVVSIGVCMKVHERMKELRKERKETQVQVAEAIGITDRQYQRFEAGKQKPGFDNFWALADHFGVTMDYLAGRTEER